jgi:hypothetical protein
VIRLAVSSITSPEAHGSKKNIGATLVVWPVDRSGKYFSGFLKLIHRSIYESYFKYIWERDVGDHLERRKVVPLHVDNFKNRHKFGHYPRGPSSPRVIGNFRKPVKLAHNLGKSPQITTCSTVECFPLRTVYVNFKKQTIL